MSITATVQNDTIKLPMHVPDGTQVEITFSEGKAASESSPHSWMLKYASVADDLPADLASKHDHYLYGTPKPKAWWH